MDFREKRPFWLLILLLVSIAITWAIFFDIAPFLRGDFGWRWPYRPPSKETFFNLLPSFFILTIYLLGLAVFYKQKTVVYLVWVFLGALILPIAFLNVVGQPFYILYTRTVSPLTTGAYLKATEFITLHELLQQWPNHMVSESGHTHLSISPPGWPAIYLQFTKLLERFPDGVNQIAMQLRPMQCDNLPLMSHTNAQIATAWLGILSPLWAALTLFPLYFLARELGGKAIARKTVMWWPLIPAISVFLGTLNTPYPLLSTLTLLFLVLGIYRQETRPMLARSCLLLAGLLAALCLMINFALVPLLLLAGLVVLLHQPNGTDSKVIDWRRTIEMGLFFAVGLLLALALYWLFAGHHLHNLVPLAMGQHLDLERPYLPWVWLHTWDVVLFVGLPIFGVFIVTLFSRSMDRTQRFALAVGLTLLIMVLSGTARGETGRVWMFFMPLFLLSVGTFFSAQNGTRWELSFGLVQIGWLLMIIAVIPAVGTGLTDPPRYEQIAPVALADTAFVPVDAAFGEVLWLQGFQAQPNVQNKSITLDLSWQARKEMTESYLFSVLAVDPTGNVRIAKEWLPLDYRYPTTCWNPDAGIVHDQMTIQFDENLAAGEWWFSLSAFTFERGSTPQYLPVTLPNGVVDDHQVGLGPVVVVP